MGTAQMILETGVHPAALKDGVTSTSRSDPRVPDICSHGHIVNPRPRAPLCNSRLAILASSVRSTAPGGCTIAGLMRMEDGNIRSTLARTIEAATRHAAGLGQEKK